ncbi:MAG: ATP-binding protein [Bifidobacterium mongoliense]|jgi:two-component system sensor histidine kinase KdpD|uniref:ATP-binding protein n=1 Tax=Bifidobacterium mongoliense TaxID=518643 RepID=UPI002F35ACD6
MAEVARGSLKVLIGAAPGVGKTYAMLREGHRLKDEGEDVAIAYLQSHGRKATADQAKGLEAVARRKVVYRGKVFEEMDLFAVLERHPAVALVDELAHSNVPGSPHDKRWQDVQDMLASGIDVITTINVQHIESLNDVVHDITGSMQRETVPDSFLRGADQIEVIDLPPQTLRERLSSGLIYAPDRVDAAMSNYFRMGNLTALRELALLWLAGNVDEALKRYRQDHGIDEKWETRERVVVALSGGPEGERLLRRGARVAEHSGGGELLAVHITSSDGLHAGHVGLLSAQRALVEKLGGSFHEVIGEDIVESLVEFARAVNATQIVVGVSSRSSLSRSLGRPSVSANLVRRSGAIDVHLVAHTYMSGGLKLPRFHGILPLKRKLLGVLFSVVALPLSTMLLLLWRDEFDMPRNVLINQVVVLLAAMIGGVIPAVLTALASGVILDYFFIEPAGTFDIAQRSGVVVLLLYVLIALLASYVVDRAERRTRIAQRARAESELMSSLAESVLRSRDSLRALVARTREAFGFCRVVLEREDGTRVEETAPHRETTGDSRGDVDPTARDDGRTVYELAGSKARLLTYGNDIEAEDQRLFSTILTQFETVLDHEDLQRKANEVEPLAAADKIRSALLSALSHDLRRPLSSATAAISGLMGDQGALGESDRQELLHVVDGGLKSLTTLVTDLLDVSRLNAKALPISLVVTDPEEVIVAALDELELGPSQVTLDAVPVPMVSADPPLLRRAISNLLLNAKRFNPPQRRIGISLSAFRSTVEIRVVDYGPGVCDERKDQIFTPFQRLGDTDNTTGLGLGLALSKGFVETMGGQLVAEDTPGGGLTMTVVLRCAPQHASIGQPLPVTYAEAGGQAGTQVGDRSDTRTGSIADNPAGGEEHEDFDR